MYKKKLMKICLASALAVSMVSTNVAPVLAADVAATNTSASIIKVLFDYDGKTVGGGDFFVDEDGDGIFNLSELTLPKGYELAETGDKFVKDYTGDEAKTVKVKPIQKSTIISVVFDNDGKTVGGGDFFVDEDGDGIFNLSELTLPEGYELAETGDKFVKDYTGDEAKTVKVKPIQKSTIINVVFEYNGETVGGGDFFVDEDGDGIFNLSELTLPEGYQLVVAGDQFVKDYADGKSHTIEVEPIQKSTIIKVLFEYDGHNVGGGDFFVDEDGDGIFNLSELILPDGYQLVVSGDQLVKDYADGEAHVVKVEPVEPKVSVGDFFINAKFVCDGEDLTPVVDCIVNGTQTDNGQCIYTMFNYSELEEYVPEGYVMTVSGDVTVYDGEVLEVNVAPKDASVSVGDFFVNVKFVSDGKEIVPAKDYIVNGIQVDNGKYVYTMFNYSELKEYVPEGYAMTAAGDATVYDGETLEVNLDKIQKESIVNVRFVYHKKVLAGGDYFVDPDGDGIFNWSELSKYVPDGYKMLRWGNESVDAGPFVVQLAKKTNSVPGTPGIDGKKNGWYKVGDSDWSYYINNRKVVSDWVAVEEADPYNNNEVGTVWYHMNSEGLMDRGWIIDESGWKVYLLDSNGRMMHSQWVNAPASEELNRPAGLYKLTDDGAVQMNGWAESVTPGIYWFCNAGTGLFEVDNPASWGSEKLF